MSTRPKKTGMRQRIRQLENEIRMANTIFGAAVISAGGEMRVTRKALLEAQHGGTLHRHDDPAGSGDVIYTVKPKEETPS